MRLVLTAVLVVIFLGAFFLLDWPELPKALGFFDFDCEADLVDSGLSPEEARDLLAWLGFGDRDAAGFLNEVGGGPGALGAPLQRADQFRWMDGTPAGAMSDFNIQRLRLELRRGSLHVDFRMGAPPRRFPMFFKVAADLRAVCGGKCRRASIPRAYAQGAENPFGGPGFREDVVIFARIDGPGRVIVRVLVGTAERAFPGSVQVSDRTVRVSFPVAALVEAGLTRPGVRLIFGIVGPPPESIYDRVPERGAMQFGVPGVRELAARLVVAKFDANGDGKDDLFGLDTNGNGLIDTLAQDGNGDGAAVTSDGEGPYQFILGGAPTEFGGIQRRVSGRKQFYAAANSQVVFLTVIEDQDGDRDLTDPGDIRLFFVPRQ